MARQPKTVSFEENVIETIEAQAKKESRTFSNLVSSVMKNYCLSETTRACANLTDSAMDASSDINKQ